VPTRLSVVLYEKLKYVETASNEYRLNMIIKKCMTLTSKPNMKI